MGSAVFVVVDNFEAELIFTAAVGLEGSGFLVAVDVAAAGGFLATAAAGGLTSFLAATVLGCCAAVVLPVDGAVVTLDAVVLAVAVVEGFAVAVLGLVVVGAGRDVEGPVAGLVVFERAVAPAFVVVEVLGFGAVDDVGLLVAAVVLGLATLTVSATGFFLTVPFTVVGLVPFVTVAAAEVVLAGPTGFLSGTLLWFLTVEETVATPIGLLGTAPTTAVADAFAAAVVVFFTAETLLEDLTSFTVR